MMKQEKGRRFDQLVMQTAVSRSNWRDDDLKVWLSCRKNIQSEKVIIFALYCI